MNNVCKGCYKSFEDESIFGQVLCPSCLDVMGKGICEELEQRGFLPDAELPVCQAADRIIDLFTSLGFTTNTKPDVELLRHSIVEIIQSEMSIKKPNLKEDLEKEFGEFFKSQ